jgi:hypothetical protein
MKQLLLAIALGLVPAATASAQGQMAAATYTISFPGSNMRDFIDQTSFRGAELVARWTVPRRSPFMAGVTLGWQVFAFETEETIQIRNGAVSGQQRRYLNAVPMLATGHFMLGDDSWRAFAGLGVGTIYMLQTFEIGVHRFEHGTWQFALAPEVGFQYPLRGDADFYVSGRYNYAFEGDKTLNGEEIAWDYWSVNVGLAWSSW